MAETQVSRQTIAAYFDDHSDARRAVDALKEAGFGSAHLGIAHRGSYTGSSTTYGNTTVRETSEKNEPSTWDKIKGWFGGETPEPYADERTRGDLASREITQSAGDRYAPEYDDTSDLDGSFATMNIPKDRARYFAHRFKHGHKGAVVTVLAGDRFAEAESILRRYQGDLGENAGSYDYSSRTKIDAGSEMSDQAGESPRRIELLGEVLRVHKDRVNRGEARIRKEVVTENQTVQVPVQREELVVERRPAEGERRASALRNEEVRVPLSEEKARLGKSTVAREEVSVGKKPVEEVRELKSDVKHEELSVEDETKRRSA